MKLEFSLQTFEKFSNIKLHENPPSGSRLVWRTDGRTDRQTDRQTTDRLADSSSMAKYYVLSV